MPKGAKSAKDPNKPKRGMSAFMFFSNEMRPKVKTENPDLPFGEIAREIAARWKDLSDAQKEKYVAKQEADKERYAEQMKSYEPQEFFDTKQKKKKKEGPKRPLSAFMCFCQTMRPTVKAENPDAKMTDLTKELAARWRALDDANKDPYQRMAEVHKARYDEEMARFREMAKGGGAY